MQFEIETAQRFNLKSTIFSHGWVDLPPFRLLDNGSGFGYVLTINEHSARPFEVWSDRTGKLIVKSEADDRNALEHAVIRMLRLDENLDNFYAIAAGKKNWQWIIDKGAGRMLRCATLWEDMVKMLCTTNCTWRLTQIMTTNLVKELGPGNGEVKGFPTPQAVAQTDEPFLREKIKLGYRAPYLLELATRITQNELDLSAIENHSGNEQELFKLLRGIKGFGDYAAGTMLKLLGRYGRMGFDSWNRKQFVDKIAGVNSMTDDEISAYYEHTGEWSGLFFWMDVTKSWYDDNFKW